MELFFGTGENSSDSSQDADAGQVSKFDVGSDAILDTLRVDVGNRINELVFDPDGNLYAASDSGAVHQIDPVSMSATGAYTGHSAIVHSLVWAEGHLYSGDGNGEIHKIDVSSMSQVAVNTEHTERVAGLAADGAGNIYSASYDDIAYRIALSSFSSVASFTLHMFTVSRIAWGTNGFVYTCSNDDTAKRLSSSGMNEQASFDAGANIFDVIWGDDSFVYVACDFRSLKKLDPSSLVEQAAVTVNNPTTERLSYGTDGFLYSVSYIRSEIEQIDPDSMTINAILNGSSVKNIRSIVTRADPGGTLPAKFWTGFEGTREVRRAN